MAMKSRQAPTPPLPWASLVDRAPVNVIAAAKALVKGEASNPQQQDFMRWLIEVACGTYDLEFRPDEREGVFAGGKRFVGLSVVGLINLTNKEMQEKRNAAKASLSDGA